MINPHHQVIKNWVDGYEARFKTRYVFTASDAAAVKRLLKAGLLPEDIQKVVTQAWDIAVNNPNPRSVWNCMTQSASLTRFAARFNEISTEVQANQPKPKAVGGF